MSKLRELLTAGLAIVDGDYIYATLDFAPIDGRYSHSDPCAFKEKPHEWIYAPNEHEVACLVKKHTFSTHALHVGLGGVKTKGVLRTRGSKFQPHWAEEPKQNAKELAPGRRDCRILIRRRAPAHLDAVLKTIVSQKQVLANPLLTGVCLQEACTTACNSRNNTLQEQLYAFSARLDREIQDRTELHDAFVKSESGHTAVAAKLAHVEEQLQRLSDYVQKEVTACKDATVSRRSELEEPTEFVLDNMTSTKPQFAVHQCDLDRSMAGRVHQVLIECPGVNADDVQVEALSNGVAVDIDCALSVAGLPNRQPFKWVLHFDEEKDGRYELRIDECGLDNGILRLILQQQPPQRFKLCTNTLGVSHSSLKSMPEASEIFSGSAVATEEDAQSCASSHWILLPENVAPNTISMPSSGDGSAVTDASSSVKCYLANTGFKSADGNLLLVQSLTVGSQVLLCSGDVARVVAWRQYARNDKKLNKLVELVTRQGSFKVSAKHRIVVPSEQGTETRFAEVLQVGDRVFVGAREQRLTKVLVTEERGDLFMMSFNPDGPVETFIVPQRGLQTKAEPLMGMLADITEGDLLRSVPSAYEE